MQAELQTALFQAFDTLNLQTGENVQRTAGHAVRTWGARRLRPGSASARRKPSVCDG